MVVQPPFRIAEYHSQFHLLCARMHGVRRCASRCPDLLASILTNGDRYHSCMAMCAKTFASASVAESFEYSSGECATSSCVAHTAQATPRSRKNFATVPPPIPIGFGVRLRRSFIAAVIALTTGASTDVGGAAACFCGKVTAIFHPVALLRLPRDLSDRGYNVGELVVGENPAVEVDDVLSGDRVHVGDIGFFLRRLERRHRRIENGVFLAEFLWSVSRRLTM